MQGVIRSHLQLFRNTSFFQQSARYYKQSNFRNSRGMPQGFFLERSLSPPIQPSFNRRIFSRTFASGRGQRPFGAYISAYYTIWGFIGLNAVVFGVWQYGTANRDRSILTKLKQNFTISVQNIKEGRWYTLLTAAFSHQLPIHFLFNIVTFHAFGGLLSMVGIGGMRLMSLCVGSALVSSSAQVYQWANDSSDPTRTFRSGLGASGVVMGAAAAATCLVPKAPMQIMFVPVNIPLWVLTVAYVGMDTFYLHSSSPVGHAAHLGGFVFGACYYATSLRRFGGIWGMAGRR